MYTLLNTHEGDRREIKRGEREGILIINCYYFEPKVELKVCKLKLGYLDF